MINPRIIQIITLCIVVTAPTAHALNGAAVAEIHSVPEIMHSSFTEIPVIQIKASSELSHQDSAGVLMQYSVNNLLDTLTNAWVEGAQGYGEGETVSIQLNAGEVPQVLGILNGYVKSTKTWQENTRVKKLLLCRNDTPVATLILKDTWKWQYFHLPSSDSPPSQRAEYTIRIVETYPGSKFKDAAITSILLLKKKSQNNLPEASSFPVDRATLFFIAGPVAALIFLLILKKRSNEKRTAEKKRAKDQVLYQLQLISDLIRERYEQEIADFCRGCEIPEEKSSHIFTVLKFAQQHDKLGNVCNYGILHEIRQFRNRMAHPDREYHHESLETLLHYQKVLEMELSRLEAYLKE
ncbi:MAG: NADase-type glycan-binding domain-containing protein [Chitinispirillaceae bacterium]